jgi:hypothetical protein
MLVEHLADGTGSKPGQSLLPQCSFQCFQGPGGRCILLAVRFTLHLLQDEGSLLTRVAGFTTSTGGNREGRESLFIEAGY